MTSTFRRRLAWLGASVAFNLLAAILFLFAVVEGIGPGGEFDAGTVADGPGLVILIVSVVFFLAGGYCMSRGRSLGPDVGPGGTMRPTTGSRLPSRDEASAERRTLPDRYRSSGSIDAPGEGVDSRVPCPECGARNEVEYRFCWNCSGEL